MSYFCDYLIFQRQKKQQPFSFCHFLDNDNTQAINREKNINNSPKKIHMINIDFLINKNKKNQYLLTQSVILVGCWLVDNVFMCCYAIKYILSHEWINLIRPVSVEIELNRDFLCFVCYLQYFKLKITCEMLVNECW